MDTDTSGRAADTNRAVRSRSRNAARNGEEERQVRRCYRRTVRRAGTPKRPAEMARQPLGVDHAVVGQRVINSGQSPGSPRRRDIFRRVEQGEALSTFLVWALIPV